MNQLARVPPVLQTLCNLSVYRK